MQAPNQSVIRLPVLNLQPNPLQPRGKMDPEEMQELINSIKQHGILEPLVVAHTPAGYQVIAGERRLRAAKMLSLSDVPVIVKETTPRGMLEMAIIENVQRVDLNPIDRAKALQKLSVEFNLANSEIADRIGKSTAYISNSLRLLTLPDAIKDGLLGKQISEGHARALAALEDTRAMVDAFKKVLAQDFSVRATEELVRRQKVVLHQPKFHAMGKAAFIVSSETDKWQALIQEAFGKKAQVKLTRSRTQTKIQIILQGDVDETQESLNRLLRWAKQQTVSQEE